MATETNIPGPESLKPPSAPIQLERALGTLGDTAQAMDKKRYSFAEDLQVNDKNDVSTDGKIDQEKLTEAVNKGQQIFVDSILIPTKPGAEYKSMSGLARTLTEDDYKQVFEKMKLTLGVSLARGDLKGVDKKWAQTWVQIIETGAHMEAYKIANTALPTTVEEKARQSLIEKIKSLPIVDIAAAVGKGLVESVKNFPSNLIATAKNFLHPKAAIENILKGLDRKNLDGWFMAGLLFGGSESALVTFSALPGGGAVKSGLNALAMGGIYLGIRRHSESRERALRKTFITEGPSLITPDDFQKRLYEIRTKKSKAEWRIRRFAAGMSTASVGFALGYQAVERGLVESVANSIGQAVQEGYQNLGQTEIGGNAQKALEKLMAASATPAYAESLSGTPDISQHISEIPLNADAASTLTSEQTIAQAIRINPQISNLWTNSIEQQSAVVKDITDNLLAQSGQNIAEIPSDQYNHLLNQVKDSLTQNAGERLNGKITTAIEGLATSDPALYNELINRDPAALQAELDRVMPKLVKASELLAKQQQGTLSFSEMLEGSKLQSDPDIKKYMSFGTQVRNDFTAALSESAQDPQLRQQLALKFTQPPDLANIPIQPPEATQATMEQPQPPYTTPEDAERIRKINKIVSDVALSMQNEPNVQRFLTTPIGQQTAEINEITKNILAQNNLEPVKITPEQALEIAREQVKRETGNKFADALRDSIIRLEVQEPALFTELSQKTPQQIIEIVTNPAHPEYAKYYYFAQDIQKEFNTIATQSSQDPETIKRLASSGRRALADANRLLEQHVAYPNIYEQAGYPTPLVVTPEAAGVINDANSETIRQLTPAFQELITQVTNHPDFKDLTENSTIGQLFETANHTALDQGLRVQITPDMAHAFVQEVLRDSGVDATKYAGTDLEKALTDLIQDSPTTLATVRDMTPRNFSDKMQEAMIGLSTGSTNELTPLARNLVTIIEQTSQTPELRNDGVKIAKNGLNRLGELLNRISVQDVGIQTPSGASLAESTFPGYTEPAPLTSGLPLDKPESPTEPWAEPARPVEVTPPIVETLPAQIPEEMPEAGQPGAIPAELLPTPPLDAEPGLERQLLPDAVPPEVADTINANEQIRDQVAEKLANKDGFIEVNIPRGKTVSELLEQNGYKIKWNVGDNSPEAQANYAETMDAFISTIAANESMLKDYWSTLDNLNLAGGPDGSFPTEPSQLIDLASRAREGDQLARKAVIESLHWVPAGGKLKIVKKDHLNDFLLALTV